jgi:hypothetical protein
MEPSSKSIVRTVRSVVCCLGRYFKRSRSMGYCSLGRGVGGVQDFAVHTITGCTAATRRGQTNVRPHLMIGICDLKSGVKFNSIGYLSL